MRWTLLDALVQDARYALRSMRLAPGFTAVAALSLALAIGANTAIFSLIDTLLLRSLPVRDPQQLVDLLYKYPTDPRLNGYSFETFEYLRDHNRVLAGLIASSAARLAVRGAHMDGDPLAGELVDGGYFGMLGVKPAAGRLIAPEDDAAQAASAAVVVSWALWKSRFDLDRSIVGRRILVADVPATIVGVAPEGFDGITMGFRTQLWAPLASAPAIQRNQRRPGVALMGRLKPGVPMEQARAELAVLFRQSLDAERLQRDPNWARVTFELEPAGAGLSIAVPGAAGRLRDQFSRPLLFLMAIVGLLLALACINVAGMLLARGAARHREMAVRVSLGASRMRLVRQALTESLLLAAVGALGGIGIAYLGAGALVRVIASGRFRIDFAVTPDRRVLLFTAAAALATGVLFGLAPALRAMAVEPAGSLRSAGRAGEMRLGRLFGRGLVVAQVALSLLLVSAAGLFAAHLSNLRNRNLGFRRDHILLATLNPAGSGWTGERLSRAYRELLDRFAAIPGVRSATLSGTTPINGAAASRFASVDGRPAQPFEQRAFVNWVAPRYFETFGTPLVAGRDFTFQDTSAARLAIVNRAMARYYFGDTDPLGRLVRLEREDKPFRIIGVVADAKYLDLREEAPRTIYLAAFQDAGVNSHRFALRTSGDPGAAAGEVRRMVDAVMRKVPVENVTLAAQMDASLVPERLIAAVSEAFGTLGALLAALGVYGLLAYTVARRINEIGIRMALGATRGGVVRLVVADALGMVVAGLAIGVPLALWGRRFARSVLDGLPLTDPLPLLLGALAMLAAALAAAWLPARRAAGVDPMEALRYE